MGRGKKKNIPDDDEQEVEEMDALQHVQRHTVASNADAIAGLSKRVSGIGNTVQNMTELLSNIAAKMDLTLTTDHADPTATCSGSRPSLAGPQPSKSQVDCSPTTDQPRHHPGPDLHALFGDVRESRQDNRLDSYGSPVLNHPPVVARTC